MKAATPNLKSQCAGERAWLSALARLGQHGAQLVGEVVQYEDSYRLCYIRGPEGVLIGLAEEISK